VQARRFTDAFPVTLLLKGSRTVIAERGQSLAFNTTGTPAMATGGMGDVLTGICAAFLAQGIAPMAAGCAGSWLLGRAAEIAEIPAAPESLSPTQVIQALPFALADARRGAWS
jgi:NAD(P)H-hydrate epimerase